MIVKRMREMTMIMMVNEKIPPRASFCRMLMRTFHRILMGMAMTAGCQSIQESLLREAGAQDSLIKSVMMSTALV